MQILNIPFYYAQVLSKLDCIKLDNTDEWANIEQEMGQKIKNNTFTGLIAMFF